MNHVYCQKTSHLLHYRSSSRSYTHHALVRVFCRELHMYVLNPWPNSPFKLPRKRLQSGLPYQHRQLLTRWKPNIVSGAVVKQRVHQPQMYTKTSNIMYTGILVMIENIFSPSIHGRTIGYTVGGPIWLCP